MPMLLVLVLLLVMRRRVGRLRGFSCHMHVLHAVVVGSESLGSVLWSSVATGGTDAGSADDVGSASATATCSGPRCRGRRSTGVACECKD